MRERDRDAERDPDSKVKRREEGRAFQREERAFQREERKVGHSRGKRGSEGIPEGR